MISPRAYMQARQVMDEKSPVSSGRRRSSKSTHSPVRSASSRRPSTISARPDAKFVRPSPSPISVPARRDSVTSLSTSAQDDAVLLDRQSSQPVSIPVKKAATTDHVPKTLSTRRPRRRNDDGEASISPAIAALLATTSIPPPKARPGRLMKANSSLTRRVSIEQLRNEWRKDTSIASSLAVGSPLDFLLGPHDIEDAGLPITGDGMESDARSFTTTSRSMSSESILSTPSLEHDVGTFSSMHSSLLTPTPSMRRASRTDRKVCSPPAELCEAHPLLATAISEESSEATTPVEQSPPAASSGKSRFRFTSNLTLSFQALKSAAKSFSNFTAPSLPSDDYLTRSLFASSQKFATEMRPRSFDSVPDPAVRRYFNPMPALSSPDFHYMLTDALGARVPETASKTGEVAAPMIPMQTYSRNRRQKKPVPREEPMPKPTSRQREPRENSDFLRVIVLEMNMRRVGKLDAKTGGRARVWLPARQSSASPVAANGIQRLVPARWVGTTMDDE